MSPSEITFELTNYCPHGCSCCSSNSVDDMSMATWLSIESVKSVLAGHRFAHIVLSGGEPLAHPQFYRILLLCEQHTDDVVVYSNAIKHLAYNAGVIDGVYLEAALNLPSVDKIRVLQRVEQGREMGRPQVSFSRNYIGDCDGCAHHVVQPDGRIVSSPCAKEAASVIPD